MLKLLGMLDLMAGIVLSLSLLFSIKPVIIIFFGAYLVLKGLIFWGDALSIGDIVIGLYFFLLFLNNFHRISMVLGLYLVLKGFTSML